MSSLRMGMGLDRTRKVTGGYSSAYTNALITQAGIDGVTLPSDNALEALDILLVGLESNGIDTKLDALYIIATDSEGFARYNVLNPSANYATDVGTPIFTNYKGLDSGAGNNCWNSNFNLSTDSSNYTLDSASLFTWQFEDTIKDSVNKTSIGAQETTGIRSFIRPISSSNITTGMVNSGSFTSYSTFTDSGLLMFNRSASNVIKSFYNGVQIDSEADASSSIPNLTAYLGALNLTGAANTAYKGNVSVAGIGGDLETEALTLYNLLEAYISTVVRLPFEAETVTVLEYAETQAYGLPTHDTQIELNAAIKSLKDDGIWAKTDALYFLATDGSPEFARINLKDPTTFYCSLIGTPVFTSKKGFDANGANNGLDTGWIPNTHGINYTLDDCSYFAWNYETQQALGINQYAMGGETGINRSYMRILSSSNTSLIASINSTGILIDATAVKPGLKHVMRTASNAISLYTDGVLSSTDTDASTILPSDSIAICLRNDDGNKSDRYDGNISFVGLGASMVSEASDLNTILNTYITNI